MPSTEALCNRDMPLVYNKGATSRSQGTPHLPTSSGNAPQQQGQEYHEQLQARQGKVVQYVNIQDALYTQLPRRNPETQDNRLIQYTNGMPCSLYHGSYSSVYYRASLHTACPRCGSGYPIGTAALLARLQTEKATQGSMPRCSRT
jgi:hypothetical protein